MQPHPAERTRMPDPFQNEAEPVMPDSERLIRDAFALDARRGYELLFRRYHRVLCSHAVRFVYSRETAQDIVSEVFLNFWKKSVHQHISTSYRAYLFTAVRNRVYNHLQDEFRRDNLLGKPTEPDEQTPAQDDPQQILQYTELFHRIEREVKALPPQCQRVFLLSRFEGKAQREIAEELQISLKTVEAHIQRALVHLRRVIQVGLQLILISLTFH